MEEKRGRGRPSLGLDSKMLLGLTDAMQHAVYERAYAEGKSANQWVREAIQERLSRSPWMEVERRAEDDLKAIQQKMNRWANRGDRR